MKKVKSKDEKSKGNSIITHSISMVFDLIKHLIKDFELSRNVKKIDKFSEKFSNIEHLMIRLEEKFQDNRKEIEELKNKLLWSNVIIIALLVTILIQVIK